MGVGGADGQTLPERPGGGRPGAISCRACEAPGAGRTDGGPEQRGCEIQREALPCNIDGNDIPRPQGSEASEGRETEQRALKSPRDKGARAAGAR